MSLHWRLFRVTTTLNLIALMASFGAQLEPRKIRLFKGGANIRVAPS